jgi:hypothetical protein
MKALNPVRRKLAVFAALVAVPALALVVGGLHQADARPAPGVIFTLIHQGRGDGGPAVDAGLWTPSDVDVDPSGNVYVADFCRIRRIVDGTIESIAVSSFCSVGPEPNIGSEIWPFRMDIAPNGDIYFVDKYHCLAEIISAGAVLPLAGNGTCAVTGNGGGTTETTSMAARTAHRRPSRPPAR